jgi:hypothetical protein
MAREFFIMHRMGNFKIALDTKNQCRAVGQHDFQYKLRMVFDAEKALDKDDYLIPHEDIDATLRKIKVAGSCERVQKQLCDALIILMQERKVPLLGFKCTVLPTHLYYGRQVVLQNVPAWLDYVWVADSVDRVEVLTVLSCA